MSERCYVEVMPCGCVTGAVVDEPRFMESIATFFAEAAKAGATVEHTTTDDARARMVTAWPCEHVRRKQDGVHDAQMEIA
jgi:uncharacterized protein YfcZ (UPF0381/DUF406 family)